MAHAMGSYKDHAMLAQAFPVCANYYLVTEHHVLCPLTHEQRPKVRCRSFSSASLKCSDLAASSSALLTVNKHVCYTGCNRQAQGALLLQ